MIRRMPLLLLTVAILVGLCSCKEYDQVTQYEESDSIVYNGVIFNKIKYVSFSCDWSELEQIAWSWYIFPLGKFSFRTDDAETLDFICCQRGNDIWIREDYDYLNLDFIIKDKNISYPFSKSYYETETIECSISDSKIAQYEWYLEEHEAFVNYVYIYKKDKKYYMRFNDTKTAYKISDDFLKILISENIISEQ